MKKKNAKNKKIINNMEFNDKYDLQKAKNLFFLSDSELLEYTNHTEYDDDENHKYIKIIKNSLHQILLNNKSENKIIYEVKDCNRLYSKDKISLQYFSNNILHYILPDNSYEVDMKNCNPQILLYLFKKHNLNHSNLEYYCNNRDDLLKNSCITKNYVLKQFNKDSINDVSVGWLIKLLEEINNNKPILFTLEQDKIKKSYIENKKKNSYNFLSSMICCILWYYENDILMKATKKYNCIVPRFDGFYTDDPDVDLDELNEITKEYNITWAKKNITKQINIKDNFNDINDLLYDIKSHKYKDVEYYFNKKHFKIVNNGTFIRKNSEIEIELLTTKQIIESYKHLHYEFWNQKAQSFENKCFIDKWIKANPNMITYDKMDYYPNNNDCPENCYNLWRKFDVELITEYKYVEDDLQILLNHIKILCGNNQEVYDFVIKYIAHLFYKPEEKIGKMILFASKEGTGKSMFYSLLKSMIGNRFYSVGDVKKNLLGNFNSALLNSYVINLEEIDYFSSKDSADILKNLITETDLEVNAKGKDAKMIKSVHRFIGNTNHTIIPLKISANDRRYCIIRSSDEKKGNSDYFTKLNQIITSKDLQATFYKYLSTIDINNFISCKIPQTEYLDELKETFETPLSDFIKELLIDNDKEIIYESSNELFRMFDIFLTKNKYKVGSDWSIRKFGLEMNEFIKEGDYITRIKKSGKNYYSIDCIKAIERFNIHNEPDNNEYCIDSD
jgi:hypothetical protein